MIREKFSAGRGDAVTRPFFFMKTHTWPVLGCGAGLRPDHYPTVRSEWPRIDWFEVVTENFMDTGGRPLAILEDIRSHYPIALHGVNLSIGTTDALDYAYLKKLKALAERVDPAVISDHFCWTGVEGEQLHDLLPLPFTEEAIAHVVERVQKIQEFLGRPIMLENPSSYFTYRHSVIPEWDFYTEISKRSGCGILLDLNNIYVNSVNHQFDPMTYLKNIPGERVGYFHLAGHTNMGDYLFDTHSKPVIPDVWRIYQEALRLWGPVSTIVEWDEDLPDFKGVLTEVEKAKAIRNEMCVETQKPLSANGFQQNCKAKVISDIDGPNLSQLQSWLKDRILSKPKTQESKQLAEILNDQHGTPGVERTLIYSNGYKVRIHEALGEVYETIQMILGEEAFEKLAYEYADHYPSRYYNLSHTGQHLAEFVRKEPLWLKQYPFLKDLAQFEWQASKAFHAHDQPAVDLMKLSKIPMESWEKATFVFQPSISIVESKWPLLRLWKAQKEKTSVAKIEPSKQSEYFLIGRQAYQIRCESLDEKQFQLIQALLRGLDLGAALEKLAEDSDDKEPYPVMEWFARWAQDGLIIDVIA